MVALSHLTLLHLPYFWDEGGYYVPAALDFYRTGTLIPVYTNAHPPLPNVVLGTLYHLFGFHILVTRLTACAFAAGALTAVFALGKRLLGPVSGLVLALLTGIYPVWFAQSSLAHADIFAAAFTLAALALYLTCPDYIGKKPETFSSTSRLVWTGVLFSASVLAKETAVIQPAALLVLELCQLRRTASSRDNHGHLRWVAALVASIPALGAWYVFHHVKTGFTFGNPAFLRYNATANFTLGHVWYALRIRSIHLFWQRNMWLPITLSLASLFLPVRPKRSDQPCGFFMPEPVLRAIAILVAANLLAFSVLGGALLTRYLLPVYPLLLLVCLAVWQSRTEYWAALAALTAVAFLSALWINPQTFFAPEDNLTYRDMIVVQQAAIHYLDQHFPDATVLTAWPVAADLTRPELGYTTRTYRVDFIENFTAEELVKAAQAPGRYDTALVFTTHYTSPAFRRFLLTHPDSWRSRRYTADLDLTPTQIALKLNGQVIWQGNRNGEWAAILRFRRSYNALATMPAQLGHSSR